MMLRGETHKFELIPSSNAGGKWTAFYLWNQGRKQEANCARCPVTTQVLEQLPILRGCSLGYCYFSVLTPGTHVCSHCGPTNVRLRCHLGLLVPDGTAIRVGSETRTWQEGKVWNKGATDRVILLIDFWHPDLTQREIEVITRLLPALETPHEKDFT